MDLNDFFQNFRISDARYAADKAAAKARSNELSLQNLQDQLDHLSLVCLAMSELLEEVGFNKSMLLEKIREIDLRDGKLDGRLLKEILCPGCKRQLAPRHVKCMYCGTALKKDSAV
jgi:hypothetical protein